MSDNSETRGQFVYNRYYRCAKCRTDLGLGYGHPRLCDECAHQVTPEDLSYSASRIFAKGYAAALSDAREREALRQIAEREAKCATKS